MKILNLIQHNATPSQLAAGVVEPPAEAKSRIRQLLTFASLPSYGEVEERAEELARATSDVINALRGDGADCWPSLEEWAVMVGGAPYLGWIEVPEPIEGADPTPAPEAQSGGDQTEKR